MVYPKVLIVSSEDVFHCKSSASFTVRSFFDGWPKECVKQIVCGEGETNDKTLFLSNQNRFLCGYLRQAKRDSTQAVSIQQNETKYYRKRSSLKQTVRQLLVNIYVSLPYKYNKRVKSFLNEFSPDIIYSSTVNVTIMRFINKISQKLRVPYIPHFFDDEPSIVFKDFTLLRLYAQHIIKTAIRRAPIVLCISELMCEEYEKRYGPKHYQALMHSVYPIEIQRENSEKKILLYAGSLYLGRYKTLVELSKIIAAYEISNIELVIYTNKQSWDELCHYYKDFSFVRYGGFVSQEQLIEEIGSAYGLVFVESFDDEMLVYTRLSMSTKIPEYLSSQRPILAIGNVKQGSIDYLMKNDAAYIVTCENELSKVFCDFYERKRWPVISKNAFSLYENNHNRAQQKELFRELLLNCVSR